MCFACAISPHQDFYPRPPRGGRRNRVAAVLRVRSISIHALREEGDITGDVDLNHAYKFLSTPSARRATLLSLGRRALPEDFYPRPPRGGRPARYRVASKTTAFLSTPSARRATFDAASLLLPRWKISIHALREEGDHYLAVAVSSCVISIHALREEGDPRPSPAGA